MVVCMDLKTHSRFFSKNLLDRDQKLKIFIIAYWENSAFQVLYLERLISYFQVYLKINTNISKGQIFSCPYQENLPQEPSWRLQSIGDNTSFLITVPPNLIKPYPTLFYYFINSIDF